MTYLLYGVGAVALIMLSYIAAPRLMTVEYGADVALVRTAREADTEPEQDTPPPPDTRPVIDHVPLPMPVKAAYMTACVAGTHDFRDRVVTLVADTELNTLIIDIKDYSGTISFPPQSDEWKPAWDAAKCGTADMQQFIAALHEKGIFVIGRITVFQDPFYAPLHPELAVKKADGTTVWRDRKGLSFIDVGSRPYWDHLIMLARDAYTIGFDELNFDYVRYPSDGNMTDIAFTQSKHYEGDVDKQANLEEFFRYLNSKLDDESLFAAVRHENTGRASSTPWTSADLFGMTTTNYDDLSIGQVQDRAAPYFDFIAPMVYPSHYPKTPSGQYATGEAVLQQFATDFPIIQHLLTYRELTKLQNTYIDGLQKKIGPDGKIHTTYSQAAVLTGRLSSSNPNLQNIPVTSALGKQIKACFVASEGMTLIAFDYSQQELRILAHLSQDETLLQAFREGRDIHKVTAAQIFSVAYEAVTKEQRSAAKTINFGIVYGMGSYGLSQQLKIPLEEADLFIQGFYANFPGIKRFFDELLKTGKERNYIETILGRRRYVQQPGKTKGFIDNNLRRELINFPIQGSAADFVKKAMVEIDKNILQKQPEVKLLLQIHDELVFEVKKELAEEVQNPIKEIMESVVKLNVPVKVEVNFGKNWGDIH
jgi:hypothetical protein